MSFNVAIDGPAGAGKSTVAKSVAALKNFIYVDTGAMYRAMALYFLRKGIDKTDESAINAALGQVEITIRYENGAQQVILNGENVSGLIRTEEVGNMASATSVYKKVREKLVELQKELASQAETGSASEAAGQGSGCNHGRPRYRNLRPSGCRREGVSDCKLRSPCKTPLQ